MAGPSSTSSRPRNGYRDRAVPAKAVPVNDASQVGADRRELEIPPLLIFIDRASFFASSPATVPLRRAISTRDSTRAGEITFRVRSATFVLFTKSWRFGEPFGVVEIGPGILAPKDP